MSSQALKQAIEPVSWNSSCGASLSGIVDEPHPAEANGGQAAAVAVGDIVHVKSFACGLRSGVLRWPAAGRAWPGGAAPRGDERAGKGPGERAERERTLKVQCCT